MILRRPGVLAVLALAVLAAANGAVAVLPIREGVAPSLIGVWSAVNEKVFFSIPHDFLTQFEINYKDIVQGYDFVRYKKGSFEDSGNKQGHYISFGCRANAPGFYTATRVAADGSVGQEYGVTLRLAGGANPGYYNLFVVRDGATQKIVERHALRLDPSAANADKETAITPGRWEQCGYARM